MTDDEDQDADTLLGRVAAARFLGCTRGTLRRWAAEGRGPSFDLVDGRPAYRLRELRQFADPFAIPGRSK